jgi:hypothetical protein
LVLLLPSFVRAGDSFRLNQAHLSDDAPRDRLQHDTSDDEDVELTSNPDADLLAFNVEMGMIPMSSVQSSGALQTAETETRPQRRARLNSHSEPLGEDPEKLGSGAGQKSLPRASSQDSAGGPISSSGALFDYFTGSQDSWDNAASADGVSASNSATNMAGGVAPARRRSSKGNSIQDNVIHKYAHFTCCHVICALSC